MDCGISLKQLRKALGKDQLKSLDAVFITHEHYDHIKGLDALGKRYELPVYINELSFRVRAHQFTNVDNRALDLDVSVRINDLTVIPFDIKHDTINSFGFTIIEDDGPVLCYFTDSGTISSDNKSLMAQADILFIECNYNDNMLRKYPGYPDFLKARIKEYHLSNRQTLDALEEIGLDNLEIVIPAHLSPRTNSPEQLTKELTKRFPSDFEKFTIAPLNSPLEAEKRCFNSISP